MKIVLDASAIGALPILDEHDPMADFTKAMVIQHDVHVPSVWWSEVSNIIVKASRKQRLTDATRSQATNLAQTLGEACTVGPDASIDRLATLAIAHTLSAYDASYAELALRLSAPMLTRDDALARAAADLGIVVLRP